MQNLALNLEGRAVPLRTRRVGRPSGGVTATSRTLGVRLPPREDVALGALAAATGRSKAELARSILADALHRMEAA